MKKPFPDLLARSIYQAAKALCRYVCISLKLHETMCSPDGTKSSGSGKPAAANWK
ncbi:MAG: hypothetical protein ACYC6G_17030 [Desulfobaccales bacterium]